MNLSVLLVDDHAVVRQGLRAYLELQPGIEVCAEAADAQQAAALALHWQPDIALVDLVMPNEDGIQATRRIRACSPATRVVVLTSSLSSEPVQLALQAGACGYQLKEIGGVELLDSLWRAARGEIVVHPRLRPALTSGASAAEDPCAALSAREREVLLLLAEGLSNLQVAERLLIGEATVKTHVGNVLGKLGLTDRTQAAIWAWRHGLVRD
ncbi:response regulator [Aquimonas sp.]|uniref:response regulator n=1 Tax=Aquimonas sp. TaxID=1872588 RepID=UPI0037BED3AC